MSLLPIILFVTTDIYKKVKIRINFALYIATLERNINLITYVFQLCFKYLEVFAIYFGDMEIWREAINFEYTLKDDKII
jgi:hypothetical protein